MPPGRRRRGPRRPPMRFGSALGHLDPAGGNYWACGDDVILRERECQYRQEQWRMVDLEFDDGLAVLTIDRPHARNAISLDTMGQLEKALDEAAGVRTLVIKGAGDRAFA